MLAPVQYFVATKLSQTQKSTLVSISSALLPERTTIFEGRNYLNAYWMDCRTFMVPRGWIPLTTMRVTFVVQWNFYRMEARAVSLQAMRRLFILHHHHHVTTSVLPDDLVYVTVSVTASDSERLSLYSDNVGIKLIKPFISAQRWETTGSGWFFYQSAWLPTIISHAGMKRKQFSAQWVCQRDHEGRSTQSWSIFGFAVNVMMQLSS